MNFIYLLKIGTFSAASLVCEGFFDVRDEASDVKLST